MQNEVSQSPTQIPTFEQLTTRASRDKRFPTFEELTVEVKSAVKTGETTKDIKKQKDLNNFQF